MSRFTGLLLFLVLLFPSPAYAIRVPGLYEAEVPVSSQDASRRRQGVTAALRAVLVKLTGDRNAAFRPAIGPILQSAERYMQQYRYKEVVLPEYQAGGEPGVRELRIWVQFDPDALDRDLRNLGVAIWGRERPSTLIWLVMRDEQGTRWLTPEDQPLLFAVLERRANLRGIALLNPLMDLEDTAALQTSDVWGGFSTPILSASARYQADTILTGAVESTAPGIWEARWNAFLGDLPATWSTESDLPEVVLDEGVDAMADFLAGKYALSGDTGEASGITVTVSEIRNVDQYARVLKYLTSLNSVAGVQVTRVQTGTVTFDLLVHGGLSTVSQAIALGRTLEPLTGSAGNQYRLLP